MNRIKANQIANGYLSEGIDEGINPEYFLANEAQAEIEVATSKIQARDQAILYLEDEIAKLGDYISELENDIKEKDEEMQLLNDKIIYLLAKPGRK